MLIINFPGESHMAFLGARLMEDEPTIGNDRFDFTLLPFGPSPEEKGMVGGDWGICACGRTHADCKNVSALHKPFKRLRRFVEHEDGVENRLDGFCGGGL